MSKRERKKNGGRNGVLVLMFLVVLGTSCADILGYKDAVLGDPRAGSGGSDGGQGGGGSTVVHCGEDDGKECTEDSCYNGLPAHAPKPEKTECSEDGGAVCNSHSECVDCVDDSSCFPPRTCSGSPDFTCVCTAPCPLWAERFGDFADQTGEVVAILSGGDIIVAGNYGGALDLGGGMLDVAPKGAIYLARRNSDGTHVWSKTFSGTGSQQLRDIAVTIEDDIVIVGNYTGKINFGGTNLVDVNNSSDIFLAKLSSDGNHIWSKRFGGTSNADCFGVATNGDGKIAITGQYRGSIEFGGPTLSSDPHGDLFVATFNSEGAHLWSKGYGEDAPQTGLAVAMDTTGSIYVAGSFWGVLAFGSDELELVSAGESDAFVVKLDGTGNPVWAHRYGTEASERITSVAVDAVQQVAISGSFDGALSLGPSQCLDDSDSNGDDDVFVAHLDSDGSCQWARTFGGPSDQANQGLAIGANGAVLTTGVLAGDLVDLDLGSVTGQGYLFEQDANGHTLAAMGFEGLTLSSLAYRNGFLYAVGDLRGTVNLGFGPMTSSEGSNDVFVARFMP